MNPTTELSPIPNPDTPPTPITTRRRRLAGLAAVALALASVLAAGGSPLTAAADEPYLPQEVGLFGAVDGCELHLGALAEVKTGAELNVVVVGSDPVIQYRETFVVGYDGIVDEVLEIGDDVMPGAGGGTTLGMAVTFEGVLIDVFVTPIPEVASCNDLVPLTVTVDATGDVPAAAELAVAVRTGECGNTHTPAAVISATPGESYTVWSDPGASCPSPVDTFGAVMSYEPVQQTQVTELVGANVTVVFGFPEAPVDPTTTTTAAEATTTTTTTTTAAVVVVPEPAVLAVGIRPSTAATPVAASPSFTG